MVSSLAGDGMLLRLRRASIALLGLVGAVGLGLIFFISQIGWPGVFSGPMPGSPTRVGTVHDAIALTHPGPALATAGRQREAVGQGAGSAAHRACRPFARSQLGHSEAAGRRPPECIRAMAPVSPTPPSRPPSRNR